MDYNLIQTIAIYALPVIFAITLHEAAHGFIARTCGDQTAYLMGRVTLNPLKHIDPVGTIAVPLVILVMSKLMGGSGMLFGWAKPVPVDFSRLHNPRRDMRYVAAAGPAANIAMALAWALMIKGLVSAGTVEPFFYEMAKAGIAINLVLAALNLLPILPLDGGRIVFSLLPAQLALPYARTEQYGMIILLILMFTNTLSVLMMPMVNAGFAALQLIFNL